MFCNLTWCSLAIVFIIANIYVSFSADKTMLKQNFYNTLSQSEINRYEKIIKERRDIYLKGYILGLIISIIILTLIVSFGFTNVKKNNITAGFVICLTGGITMLVNYLYYMLAPKSDYMVLHLDNKTQRKEWLHIYRSMQVKYHTGFILGIIAAMLLAKSVC